MSTETKTPALVRWSLIAGILGVLFCLLLDIKETPYTFVGFMFFGQPLLLVSFVLFAIQVFRDLRSKEVL